MTTQRIGLVGVVALLSAVAVPLRADAGSTNLEHELVVYSLKTYQNGWKSTINPHYSYQDPYQDFWDAMYNCSSAECAHSGSARFQNSEVTVNQMSTSAGNATNRGWTASDMVFFYGHNTTIQPQWSSSFDLWRPGEFIWTHHYISDWTPWGTNAEPYWYHRASPITDASLANGYGVFYAYNMFTSTLIGQDFPVWYTQWETENTSNQTVADIRTNKFSGEVEWIIANGCNAVTTADGNGNALSIGVSAWSKSWNKLHMVLGHYYSTDTSKLPDLGGYAEDLRDGYLVKDAYFQRHSCAGSPDGYCKPSAIEIQPMMICWPLPCSPHYMDSDTWHPNEMGDIAPYPFNTYRYHTDWDVSQ